MPIYEFKCPKCKKVQEIIMSLSQLSNSSCTKPKSECVSLSANEKQFFNGCTEITTEAPIGKCKKCDTSLYKSNQQINFAGEINMNSSSVGVAKRKYSNKAGGPKPIIDGKIRHDLNMPRG